MIAGPKFDIFTGDLNEDAIVFHPLGAVVDDIGEIDAQVEGLFLAGPIADHKLVVFTDTSVLDDLISLAEQLEDDSVLVLRIARLPLNIALEAKVAKGLHAIEWDLAEWKLELHNVFCVGGDHSIVRRAKLSDRPLTVPVINLVPCVTGDVPVLHYLIVGLLQVV